MSNLDVQPYDQYNDLIVIEGVRYAGAFFRELGGLLQPGQLFRFESRKDGVVTVTRMTGDASHEST